MDYFNELCTDISYSKKLIDLAASKWGLQTGDKIYVQDGEEIKDGHILDKSTGMLVFTQHIFCDVESNKNGITTIHLIHEAQKNTISCQGYKNQNPVLHYNFFAKSSKTANEFQNYIDLVIGMKIG